ncbi:MAG: hypothetical protein JWM87_2204 [Candidatus Eremiobacteraeota bacterium]|nr:hypothetical protein [Candidatus Eremiobacteraeota bacterium]
MFSASASGSPLATAASPAAGGTQYTSFGLPMYPTPKQNIRVLPPEPNGDGGTSESVQMDPHASLATVLAWYKAHMPAGTLQPSMVPTHATFQIGSGTDKVIQMVVLDQRKGHVQTDILLMRRTSK